MIPCIGRIFSFTSHKQNNFFIVPKLISKLRSSKKQIFIENKVSNWDTIVNNHNLCHLCVIERHGKTGEYAHGFIKNFNLKKGAVASSVGHDAHNVIVAGLNELDMKFAVNLIREYQGGVVIVKDEKLIS